MCGTCAGKGKAGGCPECNKNYIRKSLRGQIVELSDIEEPDELFSPQIFWAYNPHLQESPLIKTYIEQLEKILDMLKETGSLDRSVFIKAPSNYGKECFALTANYYVESLGGQTVPILDIDEYRRLVQISISSTPFKKLRGILYEDFLEADLAIISMPNVFSNKDTASYLCDIYRKRARGKKPTIVTSRFDISQINYYDFKKPLTNFLNTDNREKSFKIPTIVSV